MPQPGFSRPPIAVVVQQHAEESALLRHVRTVLVRAPHVQLHRLRRLDDRIAAHLDGLAVAGSYGTGICMAALERPGAGEMFAATTRAIDERDAPALSRLLALAATLPDARRGVLSALGWASPTDLKGFVLSLLSAPDPFRRELAISACRLHRTDPGPPLVQALVDDDAALRASALRTVGELGRSDLLAMAQAATTDTDPACAFRAGAAAVLLGANTAPLEALAQIETPFRDPATQLLLLAAPFDQARTFVARLAQSSPPSPQLKRRVIRAAGQLGDTQYIPWLISLMTDDSFARLAGEAFTLITGADLAALDLERKPPSPIPAGPTESPDDDDVALDEDDSLPWPEQGLVQRWWSAHAAQMPTHAPCFMGTTPSREQCMKVLREGCQRQRFIAAQRLCLLAPGTPLFPVCAPSWRQQRLLADWVT